MVDDTAAVQRAMDAMAKAGGGTVNLGRGTFMFRGHLTIPRAVTLSGIWQSVASHIGLRWPGQPRPTEGGTTLLVTESRGNESGPPFITLNTNSTLKGVSIYYPDQNPDETPVPYPYCISMHGTANAAVLNVEMLNPYNGIDASQAHRHLIRNVIGQPLRRGIYLDMVLDVGRIENIHFNPWWSNKPKVHKFQMSEGEAFVIGRADWQYMLNTFCYGYHIGYDFIETKNGRCNGNFLGIGADDCEIAVNVDSAWFLGVLITNGEFASFNGPDPTIVRVAKSNRGAIRFVNCAFWGYDNLTADIAGSGTVGFSDCTFSSWQDPRQRRTDAMIRATGGTLLVHGCQFVINRRQIDLGPGVAQAVITDNIMNGPVEIHNESEGEVVIKDNVGRKIPTTDPMP